MLHVSLRPMRDLGPHGQVRPSVRTVREAGEDIGKRCAPAASRHAPGLGLSLGLGMGMCGALGLGPCCWRARDPQAGAVALAPRGPADVGAFDVFAGAATVGEPVLERPPSPARGSMVDRALGCGAE